jgi:hypothetical protein
MSNTNIHDSGVNEPRRSEGHEGRRKKEEEEGSSMSSQIYLVIEE